MPAAERHALADDVILTNVIGFDVKAWDPTAGGSIRRPAWRYHIAGRPDYITCPPTGRPYVQYFRVLTWISVYNNPPVPSAPHQKERMGHMCLYIYLIHTMGSVGDDNGGYMTRGPRITNRWDRASGQYLPAGNGN